MSGYSGKEIIAYHDQWPYLTKYLGLRVEQFLEVKPGIAPTPRHIEFLQKYIVDNQIPVIAQASFFPKDSSEVLAERTGAQVVDLCHNVGEDSECADFISMIDVNVKRLAGALGNG
jgi:ABC-type Zn uptake system ZnuABC Zn-binding protein ZnuA